MTSEAHRRLRSFCVVIPMYNEERGAEDCVRRVCGALAQIPYTTKLLAVDDGSRDQTGSILDRLAVEFVNLSVIHQQRNGGYGAALRTGMRRAAEMDFDYALFMDSDLTNDPSDIPRFAAQMERGVDVIKATRYSLGGGVTGVPQYRVMISKVGNLIARILFRLPVADCTNGFRAVKTGVLMKMHLSENRFPIIMEELYWCKFLAHTYAEVPVTLTDRMAEQRATSFTYRPSVFWSYFKYPLRAFLGIKPLARWEQE